MFQHRECSCSGLAYYSASTTIRCIYPMLFFSYLKHIRALRRTARTIDCIETANSPPPADAEDESLAKWKASLGISTGPTASDPSDPRRCIIKSLILEVKGRSDIVIDLSAPGSVEKLKSKPFTIKEGAEFNMKVVFKVQHDVLSGLKYVQVIKRKGIKVAKEEEMLVRFTIRRQRS